VADASLLYPFTLGMMAAVNPCGFPLLPAYLELFVGPAGHEDSTAARSVRAVSAAAYATVGFLVLFGLLGLLTEVGWSAVVGRSATVASYAMVAFGVVMVGLGILTLTRRSLKLPLPQIGSGAGLRRPAGLAVFGFSYGVASIGCALPLFVGGVAASFGRHGSFRGVSGLLAYGLGMGTILAVLALGIAVLGRGAGRHLRKVSSWVPVVGGVILVAIGAYLTWYWVADIAAPGHTFAVQRLVERVQLDIANPIDAHARLIGALLGAVVVLAVVAGGLARPGAGRAARATETGPPAGPRSSDPTGADRRPTGSVAP
jgi:cytochrome c-type biogenesis protein